MALHTLVFIPLFNESMPQLIATAKPQTLLVTLQETNKNKPASPTEEATDSAIQTKKHITKEQPTSKPRKNINIVTKKSAHELPKKSTPIDKLPYGLLSKQHTTKKTSDTQKKNPLPSLSSEQLSAKIQQAINPYFYYPKLAIRKNWQGTVKLVLRINERGEINHIRIFKSSGYRILDLAAVKSMQKITSIPLAGLSLPRGYIDEMHTIEYRLIDS